MTEHLHVVDGGGYLHRAYHGAGGESAPPPAALGTFAAMLGKLEYARKPRRAVVAFDHHGLTWRHELFPAYKAHRDAPARNLVEQYSSFRPIAEACGWPTISVAGYEADDIIATLVARALERGWRCSVYAADKDLLQLVGPDVDQVDEARNKIFDRAAVIDKLGVPPDRVADYLALCGDAGDGVPGVPGIGPKTAAELVARHATLEAVIAACPKVRGKLPLGEPAIAEQLRLSRRLVELPRDVDVGRDLEALVMHARCDAKRRELLTPPRPPEQLELGRPRPLTEDQAERAAILEYEAGMSRGDAERRARELAGQR